MSKRNEMHRKRERKKPLPMMIIVCITGLNVLGYNNVNENVRNCFSSKRKNTDSVSSFALCNEKATSFADTIKQVDFSVNSSLLSLLFGWIPKNIINK
jgi:hypothetical protein